MQLGREGLIGGRVSLLKVKVIREEFGEHKEKTRLNNNKHKARRQNIINDNKQQQTITNDKFRKKIDNTKKDKQ